MPVALAPASAGRHPQRWLILTAGLLVAEFWLFTWGRGSLGDYASGIALTLCGLLACLGTYLVVRGQQWSGQAPIGAPSKSAGRAMALATFAGLVACSWKHTNTIRHFVISIGSSDIIPALSIYPRRLMAGEVVYTPFTDELGYFALPTYLPATWGPYLVPEVLGLDYRWMAFGLLLLGIASYLWLVRRLRLSTVASAGLALLPFALTFAIQRTEEAMFGYTVEEMIAGYYFLLITGLLAGKRWLLVLGLVLCLLSRFSLVLWVPFLFGLMYLADGRRAALAVAGLVAAGVVAVYVVPFMSQDWTMFFKVQQSYTTVAVGEWTHLNERGLPYHLYNGVGLGNLFYHYLTGPLLDRIILLKRLHILALLGTLLGATLVYWREPQPRTDYRVFSVLVLKFYLVLFYALLQVPYAYLASLSLFVSCFLVLLLVKLARPQAVPAVV